MVSFGSAQVSFVVTNFRNHIYIYLLEYIVVFMFVSDKLWRKGEQS